MSMLTPEIGFLDTFKINSHVEVVVTWQVGVKDKLFHLVRGGIK